MFRFETYNVNGLKIFDVNDGISMILGSLSIGGNSVASGSITVPELARGRPFAAVTFVQYDTAGFVGYRPNVSVSGTTIYWSFPSRYTSGSYPVTKIIYGVD